jgi:hypothetical protein
MIDRHETAVLKQLTNAQLVFDAMSIETTLENDFDHDIGAKKEARTASLSFTFPQSVRGDSNLSVSVSHRSTHVHVTLGGNLSGKTFSEHRGPEQKHEVGDVERAIRWAIQSALQKYYLGIESAVLGRPIRA